MKKLIISLLYLAYAAGSAYAQQIEIRTFDADSSAMPYAFIYLNNRGIGITDTAGRIVIPSGAISVGDTISVTYLGMKPQTVVCGNSAKTYSVYLIEAKEFNIDEVIVTPGDAEKMFRKYSKITSEVNYNCVMNADFEGTINNSKISGSFNVGNEIWSKEFLPRSKGWFHHPINFTSLKGIGEDTIKKRMLNNSIHVAFNMLNSFLGISRANIIKEYRPYYRYLGNENDHRIFRISYPKDSKMFLGYPAQAILYINKNTKDIDYIEIELFNEDDQGTFSITSSFEIFNHKNPRKNPVLLPVNFKYHATVKDRIDIELDFSNISFKHKKWK